MIQVPVAIVLTVYGIETELGIDTNSSSLTVAIVLTVYGIETIVAYARTLQLVPLTLQQYLPFTVLKPTFFIKALQVFSQLQQYLPFTVLKRLSFKCNGDNFASLLQQYLPFTVLKLFCNATVKFNNIGCNSTYRLRY